jgi:MoaA/NifB/PqqE/SkfB family radical SAM enzyme
MSKGFLKFEDFKKFIDKYHYFLKFIFLSNYGEIFLNPEIFQIIKYAKEKNIRVASDTNLNYFNEKMASELVKSNMDHLIISIDGATNRTYKKYRVGGDFKKVILNIKMINEFKKKYNSKYPLLTWQFILFNHNKHEIHKAKEMAKKFDMEFKLKENWSPTYSKISEKDRQKIKEKISDIQKYYCYQLWEFPRINYNGNLLGCCIIFQEKHNFGNVFREDFFKVFNSKKIRDARKMILKNKDGDYIPCLKCNSRRNFNRNLFSNLNLMIDMGIGKIGIFLKKNNPTLYYKLKNKIKR